MIGIASASACSAHAAGCRQRVATSSPAEATAARSRLSDLFVAVLKATRSWPLPPYADARAAGGAPVRPG